MSLRTRKPNQIVDCAYCSKPCRAGGGVAIHEKYCSENPNRKITATGKYSIGQAKKTSRKKAVASGGLDVGVLEADVKVLEAEMVAERNEPTINSYITAHLTDRMLMRRPLDRIEVTEAKRIKGLLNLMLGVEVQD